MRVLLLAPHPFFQPRGTPIAVDMLLKVLSDAGHTVDVVTFPEGEDRIYPNVRIYRANPRFDVSGVRPGFSLKKLYCDWALYRLANKLIKQGGYDLVHAVEEAAFFGLIFARRYRIPFIYDMDSSLSAQMADKSSLFKLARPMIEHLEQMPVKKALAVAPMCQELADGAATFRDPESIFVIKDVSLLGMSNADYADKHITDLRESVSNELPIILYVGNLERYQGVDLLLQTAQELVKNGPVANFVFIGGVPEDIEKYRTLAEGMGIANCTYFLGPRPVNDLGAYLTQADILVSPRTQGSNTPMKVYSYLDSGTPTVATRLATHTQVMNDHIAVLTEPDPVSYAQALNGLLVDPSLRQQIGQRAKAYAQKEHSYATFVESVTKLYKFVEANA